MKYDNVWDYFKEIYCINLDHRIDRWEHAQTEFESVGVLEKVNRFSAIKNENGKLGLIKSFLEIFKDVKKRNIKNVLIFEDDVKFINEPLSNLKKSISQIDNFDWGTFYLGATLHVKCNKVSPNILLLKHAYAAHAVAYESKTYDDIINQFEKTNEVKNVYDINDVFFANVIQNKYLSLLIYPMIATQYPSFSDLEKHEVNYTFIEERFKQFTS